MPGHHPAGKGGSASVFPGWGGGKAASPAAPDGPRSSCCQQSWPRRTGHRAAPHPNTSLPPRSRGELDVTFWWLLLRRLVAGPVRLPVGVLQGVLQAQLVAHLEGLAHRAHHAHGLALRGREPPWSALGRVPQPQTPPLQAGCGARGGCSVLPSSWI